MAVPEEIKKKISERLEAFIASTPDEELRSIAASINALPLALDSGGGYAIRPDGEMVCFLWDKKNEYEIEESRRIQNMALFQGSKKYPELRALIPARSLDDIDCTYCKGTGIVAEAIELRIDNLVCYCGGLGWIAKEERMGT